MKFGCYLHHTRFHSLLYGDQCLHRPLRGMSIRKLICEYPGAENIMMFDFAHFVDKCLCRPSMFPVTGSDIFGRLLCTDTRCTLFGQLTADCLDMDTPTSHRMLLPIVPASSLADDF